VKMMNKPCITEGIISVANHRLRVEGIESYKKCLEEEYYSVEQIEHIIDERIKDIKEKLKEKVTDSMNSFLSGLILNLENLKTKFK